MAAEELSSVHILEKTVTQLANMLGFPKFLVSRLLAPFLSHAVQLSVNDVCFLLDMIGFNQEALENKGIKISANIEQLRYILGSMAIGKTP